MSRNDDEYFGFGKLDFADTQPSNVSATFPFVTSAQESAREAARIMWEHHREVEERLLGGENSFEMRNPVGQTIQYEVPAWTSQPLVRLKLEWYRLAYRRGL